MEPLTLHEAVPGHHLQISLAQENGDLPQFRQHKYYSGYGEGWALYCETIGSELGMYQDTYRRVGQLIAELRRAVRLVVDTGLHAKGWTRERAIQYLRDFSSENQQDLVVEVDRYIILPGQALSYKIGQLKITELRRNAEHQLGARFDVRQFHGAVLGNGALPLDLLETQVKDWAAGILPAH